MISQSWVEGLNETLQFSEIDLIYRPLGMFAHLFTVCPVVYETDSRRIQSRGWISFCSLCASSPLLLRNFAAGCHTREEAEQMCFIAQFSQSFPVI